MRRFLCPVTVLALVSLWFGCGSDGGGETPIYNFPENVQDLAEVASSESTVTLAWTAPALVTKSTQVDAYDLRYSLSPITTDNWDSATAVTGEPAPAAAGDAETLAVGGLDPGTTYSFALRSVDSDGDWSGLSNIASASTDSADAPAAVANLAAIASGDSTITLTWTAPALVTKDSAVVSYDLRYALSTITLGTWDAATTVSGEPTPAAPGEPETLTVGGLDLGTTYSFAIRSVDDGGDWSGLSNVVSASTDSIDDRLLAYYPLVDDANDATGHYGPMSLTHTPFQDGGIYCNGIYIGDDGVNGSVAFTPNIDSLDFGAFTIRARFRVDDYAAQTGNPVFIGGDLYRWLGYYLEADSTVSLMFGGGSRQSSDVTYTPGTWHQGTVTYDGSTARLYLDGTFACERSAAINHGDNRKVGTSNGSSGYEFEGLFSRLKIYDGVIAP